MGTEILEFDAQAKSTQEINISKLPAGIYFIRAEYQNSLFSKLLSPTVSFVVER